MGHKSYSIEREAMPKKKILFPSTTTPGHRMELKTWLVELVMIRANKGIRLPAKFWSDSRWKWKFINELKAVTKHLKKYGEGPVIRIVYANPICSFSNYAELEFLLQAESDRQKRLAAPKDNSEVQLLQSSILEDFREERPKVVKKNLFDKLSDLEK